MPVAFISNYMESIVRIRWGETLYTHEGVDPKAISREDEVCDIYLLTIDNFTNLLVSSVGSKAHDNSSEQDGMDAKDHSELQALQNHNLLIALGGVARGASSHFPMSVS